MRPETSSSLLTARFHLGEADTMLGASLWSAAAKTAYLATFHAARAYIFERTGKVAKTHRGVRSEFHRLTMETAWPDATVRSILATGYRRKEIADYSTDASLYPTADDARATLETAIRFVAFVTHLLEAD